jgi:hypothetical protein
VVDVPDIEGEFLRSSEPLRPLTWAQR